MDNPWELPKAGSFLQQLVRGVARGDFPMIKHLRHASRAKSYCGREGHACIRHRARHEVQFFGDGHCAPNSDGECAADRPQPRRALKPDIKECVSQYTTHVLPATNTAATTAKKSNTLQNLPRPRRQRNDGKYHRGQDQAATLQRVPGWAGPAGLCARRLPR